VMLPLAWWWLGQEILSTPSIGLTKPRTSTIPFAHFQHTCQRVPAVIHVDQCFTGRKSLTDSLARPEHSVALLQPRSFQTTFESSSIKTIHHSTSVASFRVIKFPIKILPGPGSQPYLGLLPLCSWNG
jgi:hypothetical protein